MASSYFDLHRHFLDTKLWFLVKRINDQLELQNELNRKSTARFVDHVNKVIAGGQRLSGYVLRTFKIRDKILMVTLMKSLIVSTMEYACVVWSPVDTHQMKMVREPATPIHKPDLPIQ